MRTSKSSLLLFLVLLLVATVLWAMPGDQDGDTDVDVDDLQIILAARNTPASGPSDPRDLDADGVITVLDARIAATLCTRPLCATGNNPPTVEAPADQTIPEDGTTGAIAVTVDDPDLGTNPNTLVLTATSDDQTLIPGANLVLGGSGNARTITVTPAANLSGGPVTITLQVSDGIDSATDTFSVMVTPVNDAPQFTAGPDQTVLEDSGAHAVPSWATAISPGPPDEAGQTVSFNVTGNTDPGLFAVAPAVDGAGNLTYTPAAEASGTATITLVAMDDGGTANGGVDTSPPQSFDITITAVNDEPSFMAGADQTIDEDAGAQTVANWATGISAGPADESGQMLTFNVTNNTNATLFSAQPAVASDGTLTYTPAPDANGTATVTLELMDDGGTANGGDDTSPPQTFQITVDPVNDAPTISTPASHTSDEDAGAQTVVGFATLSAGGGPDESGQTVTPSITGNDNMALFSSQPQLNTSGTLTYTAAPNAFGTATITAQAMDDGGTASGGVDTSAPVMFQINIDSVNDPPVAVADSFDTLGNTELFVDLTPAMNQPRVLATTTSTFGVLDNDSDPVEMDMLSVAGIVGCADTTAPFEGCASTSGGVLDMQSNGRFTYVTSPGFGGATDTFQYLLSDGMDTVTATVTINVAGVVWFVDNTAASGGDGTSTTPFDMLSGAEAASAPGDVIYVRTGDGTSLGQDQGIALQSMQTFLGEGVDLEVDLAFNGNPAPTLIFDSPSNDPAVIEHTAGDGVTVDATAGPQTGVVIRGFQISGTSNAVDVTQTGANAVEITIADNLFQDSGSEALDLNPGGGAHFEATIQNNSFSTSSPTGNAIDVTTTANADTVQVAIDDNVDITSSSGDAIHLDGSAGGTLNVTSLCGNSVHGATAGAGIFADTVVFDAAPLPSGDADFVGDTVACTAATLIGSSGNRIGGSGLVLLNVTGDLDLGPFSSFVGTAGGLDEVALQIAGNGVFNAGAGNGFQFVQDSGTLDSIDGPAVLIDTARLEYLPPSSVTTVVSMNSDTVGIGLTDVSSSFAVSGTTTIDSTGTDGVVVTDSSAQVTFLGEFVISNTGGRGVSLTNMSADFVVQDMAPAGLPGTANSLITGTTGDAFSSVGHTDDIRYYGDIVNTSGNSVDIRDHGGPAGQILFAGLITDSGEGIYLDNNDQGAMPATASFTGGLDLDTGANTAFTAINGGNVEVLSGSVSTTADTTTGTLVNIVNTTITANGVFFDSTSKTGGANGIILTNVGSGNFISDAGSISNQTNRGVDVSSGSGDVVVDASISTTSTGRSVEVTTHTGGTVDFNGSIDDNGLGIRLANNVGAVLRFDGGMDVDTAAGSGTEEGFEATGGGTVHLTGTNEGSTPLATGIAVNIVGGTTIGGDGVTFRSVSANGAPSGILLANTGTTGGFTVTGVATTDESGGVIDNTTGDAVVLDQVDSLTLRNMRLGESTTAQGDAPDSNIAIAGDAIDITDSSNLVFTNLRIADTSGDGIKGTGVTNLTLSDSEIFNVGLDAGFDESAFDFGDQTAGADQNLVGTVSVSNTVFDGMQEFGMYVYNETGSLTLTITGGRFSNQRTNNAEAGILLETNGAGATMDVTITGILCDVLEGAACVFAQALDGTMDLVATGNTAQNGGSISNFNNTDGFNLATGDGTLNFDISDNDLQRNRGHGVRLAANFAGTLNGRVTGNDIDGDGPFPPAASAQPILLLVDGAGPGDPTAYVLIDDNDIDDVVDTTLEMIDIEARDGVTNLHVTVTNNRINQDGAATLGNGDHGIEIRARDSAMVRANVSNNTVDSPDASVNLDVEDGATMEATVVSNALSSSGDDELQAETEDAGTSLCLDLRGHNSGVFALVETAGTFTMENFASVAGDNSGATIQVGGGISADGGTCIEPTAPTFPPP